MSADIDAWVERLRREQEVDNENLEDLSDVPADDEPDVLLDNKQPRRSGRKRKVPMNEDDLLEMEESMESQSKKQANGLIDVSYKPLNHIEHEYGDSSCDELEIEETSKNKHYFDEETGEDELNGERKKVKKVSKARSHNPLNCFACGWGHSRQSAINLDSVNDIITIMEENYGRINNLVLARMVHVYYKERIWKIMVKKDPNFPIWRTLSIKQHIEGHTLEPRIFIGEQIKKLRRDLDELDNMAMSIRLMGNGSRITALEKTVLGAQKDKFNMIMRLYQTNYQKMNFYDPKSKIDPVSIGRVITDKHQWELKKVVQL